MTDLETREGVKTTTSMIERALTLPVDPRIRHEVRRFGFEYEMFPSGYRDTRGSAGYDDELEVHMDGFSERFHEGPRDNDCWCGDCEDEAYNLEVDRWTREHRPSTVTFTGGPRDLVAQAYSKGLIYEDTMHSYHCHCSSCEHDRTGPLMTAQGDCTCGVEFVSRIIDLQDFDEASRDIDAWIDMMQGWAHDGHWMPDGHTSNGNHVHVSSDGDEECRWKDTPLRQRAFNHGNAIYAAFDWDRVADGGCGSIRGYNSKPQRNDGYSGNWLSDRGYGTFEHRLWNTPKLPERLWAHLGISIGLQRWAFNIAQNLPDAQLWTTVTDRYGYGNRRMDDEAYYAITNNVGELVRGIRAYIPQHDQFDIARDLIVNLTPTR